MNVPCLKGVGTVTDRNRGLQWPLPAGQHLKQPYLCFRNWADSAKTLSKTLMESPHSGCCHPVWKTFENLCYEESATMPVLTQKGKMAPFPIWCSLSQCGRTCVRFQHNTADDKIAYEKRQMAAVTLLGGPTSIWHIEPVNDYFCISQQFFFSLGELDWYMGRQSWCSALIWGFSLLENCHTSICFQLNIFSIKWCNKSRKSVRVYVLLSHCFCEHLVSDLE